MIAQRGTSRALIVGRSDTMTTDARNDKRAISVDAAVTRPTSVSTDVQPVEKCKKEANARWSFYTTCSESGTCRPNMPECFRLKQRRCLTRTLARMEPGTSRAF